MEQERLGELPMKPKAAIAFALQKIANRFYTPPPAPPRSVTLKQVIWDMPDQEEMNRWYADTAGRVSDADPSLIPIGCRVLLLFAFGFAAYWLFGCGP